MPIHRSTVDGVPVFWTDGGSGPVSAGLVFRVGRADETFATSGLTHLLEHLVLFPVDHGDLHVNGTTSPGTTTFQLDDADEAELVAFLGAVCAGLRNPPVERLETEKAILRTEGSRREGAADDLPLWRYGPAGFGLPALEEYGLATITAADVRGWAATRFTRGNAALWITGGPPPAGLRLDLPDGPRMPYPEAVEVLPRLPAYFTAPVNGVVVDLVVPRSRAALLYAAVLDRRLYAHLRRELGVSYLAAARYQPRDAGHAVVTAMADALPDRRVELCRAVVDILIDLSRHAPSEDELGAARTVVDRAASPAAEAESLLAGALAHGVPKEAGPDVLAVGRQALDGALALLPDGCAIGRAGFVRAPNGSRTAVDGVARSRANRPDAAARLVIGADGVSIRDGLRIVTVRFAECRGMLAWPDGARRLFGADAVTVTIEPTLWDVPLADLARLDAAVPTALIVGQPAREPDRIPIPPDVELHRPPPPAVRPAQRRWLICGAGAAVLAAALAAQLPPVPTVIVGALAIRAALYAADRH